MQFNSPVMRAVRRALRATGLARPLGRVMSGSGGYEQHFNARLIASIEPDDTVWDVGANIGHYTAIFAGLTGERGKVYAFEPSPANYTKLRKAIASFNNVTTFQLALSDRNGSVGFRLGADELGATSRVLAHAAGEAHDAAALEVEVTTGDDLVAKGQAAPANVIKIDVEGHELEVLRGLSTVLSTPDVRHVFVEVHFSLLEEQGRADAPDQIVQMFTAAGYRVNWVDPSHLHATRARN